ncbi:hypothetical protein D0T84_16305 [Dysgonomonas sp. 521]|uniref:hypothetical protein n=1 Tax=Dysgonomonas sp. 521 TaxID=2302932 RepID=UPI0013D57CFE|nr:hypothetical protein [Dysgonomonas sp. 521]NDV96464.1 hypothetical protein [Dysgonomonas sp. 521]
MACQTATDPNSLEWCEGQVNLPGIRPKVYFTPKSTIVKWPTRPTVLATGETMGKLATYTGNFELAADKVWQSMDIIEDRSPATADVQGTKPSKTYLNQAVLVVPNVDAEAAGLSQLAANSDYVYLVQDKPGKFRVLGNEMYQTNTDVAMALGGSATDEMGTTITASVTDSCHMPFYEGEIETADGIINPSTPETP